MNVLTRKKFIGRIFASEIVRRLEELCGVTATQVESLISERVEINVPMKEPASERLISKQ